MFRPGLVRLTLSSSLVWTAWSGARRRRRRRRWGGRPPIRKQPMSIDVLLKLNMSVLQKPALCPISQQLALKISIDVLLVSLLTEYNSTKKAAAIYPIKDEQRTSIMCTCYRRMDVRKVHA